MIDEWTGAARRFTPPWYEIRQRQSWHKRYYVLIAMNGRVGTSVPSDIGSRQSEERTPSTTLRRNLGDGGVVPLYPGG